MATRKSYAQSLAASLIKYAQQEKGLSAKKAEDIAAELLRLDAAEAELERIKSLHPVAWQQRFLDADGNDEQPGAWHPRDLELPESDYVEVRALYAIDLTVKDVKENL